MQVPSSSAGATYLILVRWRIARDFGKVKFGTRQVFLDIHIHITFLGYVKVTRLFTTRFTLVHPFSLRDINKKRFLGNLERCGENSREIISDQTEDRTGIVLDRANPNLHILSTASRAEKKSYPTIIYSYGIMKNYNRILK